MHQHHDLENIPFTDTFKILGSEINGTVEIAGEEYSINLNTITEIDCNGNILWHWRTYERIPFNQTHFYFSSTRRGIADWTNGNAVFRDYEEDVFYYNASFGYHEVDLTGYLLGDKTLDSFFTD